MNSNYVFQELAMKMVNAVEEIGGVFLENASTHLHVHLKQDAQIPMKFVTKRPGRQIDSDKVVSKRLNLLKW